MNRNRVEISRFWNFIGWVRMGLTRSAGGCIRTHAILCWSEFSKYWVRMDGPALRVESIRIRLRLFLKLCQSAGEWPALRMGPAALVNFCIELNFLKTAKYWVRMRLTRSAGGIHPHYARIFLNLEWKLSKSRVRVNPPAVRMGASAFRVILTLKPKSKLLSLSLPSFPHF